MTEQEFLNLWQADKAAHQAWGDHIREFIVQGLASRNLRPDEFLKLPPSVRLKADTSLVDKAFYRRKPYADPYREIEDKVGVRFVVLLTEEIRAVRDIIESNDSWSAIECKNFQKEKDEYPLLFTYQSLHFVVRPKQVMDLGGVTVDPRVACEVQVRTLLQHAHSELTHDTIYKPNKLVLPPVVRTAAKSMALIETADDLFSLVVRSLNSGPVQDHDVLNRLDRLYKSLTGRDPISEKATLILLDEYESVINDDLIERIENSFSTDLEYAALAKTIEQKFNFHQIYQQGIVLFVYWMLKQHRRTFKEKWPFDKTILAILAADVGAALDRN